MKRAIAPTDAELAAFRAQCAAVAGAETAAAPTFYMPELRGPLHQHCLAVAVAVQARWGGALINGRVPVKGRIETWKGVHWWNILPDGRAVDLTSEQFGGDGLAPPIGAVPWAQCYPAAERWARREPHVRRFLVRLRAARASEVSAA